MRRSMRYGQDWTRGGAIRPMVLALLHSPMITGSCWGCTPGRLRALGVDTLAVEVTGDERPPFAERYVRAAAETIRLDCHGRDVVLVGHSGAGPLLPALAAALEPEVTVPALIYCDAHLPRPGANRLDLMDSGCDTFRAGLAAGHRYPDWTDEQLIDLIPSAGHRTLLLAGAKARGEAFFTEPLPCPPVPPTTAQGYLRLCRGYERPAAAAERRGWPVVRLDEGHFHPLVDPEATAAAMAGLAASLVPAPERRLVPR
jgi:hypothetical protein